ncbi:chromatin-modulating protein mrc1 [Bulinus truncatus]|nr:chromatin-modulating protein mrc1 [Bulinus truncatus]
MQQLQSVWEVNGYTTKDFVTYFSDGYKTWFDARADCLSRGGDLASVLSQEENSFILSQLNNRKLSEVWIGFNSLKNNSFFWSDGSPTGFIVLSDTNGVSSDRQCVVITIEAEGWYSVYCGDEVQYVCKKLNDTTSTTVPSTTPRIQKGCPAGFVGSDKINKCYCIGGLGNQPVYDWNKERSMFQNVFRVQSSTG